MIVRGREREKSSVCLLKGFVYFQREKQEDGEECVCVCGGGREEELERERERE